MMIATVVVVEGEGEILVNVEEMIMILMNY